MDEPLHIRLDESRLGWIDFLHEHTHKKKERARERMMNRETARQGGKRQKVQSGTTVRRVENTSVNARYATVSPPFARETSLAGSKTLV